MKLKNPKKHLAIFSALLVWLGGGGVAPADAQNEDVPEIVKTLLEEGDRHRQADRVEEAIDSYEEARRLSPSTVAVYEALGGLYHGQGDLKRALEAFVGGLEHDPARLSLLFNAAVLSRRLEASESALGYVGRALESHPRSANLHSLRSAALRDLNRLEEALTAQQTAAKLDAGNPQVQYRLGNLYYELDKKDQAIEAYRKAIKKDKSYLRAYYNLGAVLFEMDRYDEALSAYLVALEPVQEAFASGKTVDVANARAFLNLGAIYFQKKNWTEALDAYSKALRLNPEQAGALYNQGYIYFQQGQYDLAAAAHEKALKLDPELPLASLHLGEIYFRRGTPETAVPQLRKALSKLQGTERLQANILLARSHQALGETGPAREAYRAVLADDPNHLDSLVALGRSARREGQTQEARELLERAWKLAPTDAGVALELAGLARSDGDLEGEKKLYEQMLAERAAGGSNGSLDLWPVRVNLARVLLEQGHNAAARQAFEPVVRRLPQLVKNGLEVQDGQLLATVHGLLLASEGKLADASKRLRAVVGAGDSPLAAREALAVLEAFGGAPETAAKVFSGTLSEYLGQALENQARANLGQFLWLAGRAAEAKDHLARAAPVFPHQAGLQVALAEIAYAEGDVQGAVSRLAAAVKLCGPDSAADSAQTTEAAGSRQLRVTLGASSSTSFCDRAGKSLATMLVASAFSDLEQARDNGNSLRAAQRNSEKALKLPLTEQERALAYFVHGTALLFSGADQRAKADLVQALNGALPQSLRVMAQNNLGVARYRLGEVDAARAQFEAAGGRGEAGLNLGVLLDEKTGDKARALELYEAYLASGGRRKADAEAWAERLRRIYR